MDRNPGDSTLTVGPPSTVSSSPSIVAPCPFSFGSCRSHRVFASFSRPPRHFVCSSPRARDRLKIYFRSPLHHLNQQIILQLFAVAAAHCHCYHLYQNASSGHPWAIFVRRSSCWWSCCPCVFVMVPHSCRVAGRERPRFKWASRCSLERPTLY